MAFVSRIAGQPKYWKRAVAACGLTFIIIGLCTGGAQSAAQAALLALALSIALIAAALIAPKGELLAALERNTAPALAALALAILVLASAWIAPADATPAWFRSLWHPLWREFGFSHGAISISPYRSIEGLVGFFVPAAAFALGALTVVDRSDRRLVSLVLVIGAATFAAVALAGMWTPSAARTRLDAHLGSPNAAAMALGVFTLLLAARVVRISRRNDAKALEQIPAQFRPVQIIFLAPVTLSVLALTQGALVMTSSRAGIVVTLAAFILFGALVFMARRSHSDEPLGRNALVGVGLIGIVLLGVGAQLVLPRLGNFAIDVGVRGTLMQMHWDVFLDRPWLGHGLHTFHDLNAHYLTPETWREAAHVGAAHNIFIQALEEVGLIGVALFAIMLFQPVRQVFATAVNGGSGAEWAAAAFAATALAFGHGLIDYGLQVPALAALILFCVGAFTNGGTTPRHRAENPTPAQSNANTASANPAQSARLMTTAMSRDKNIGHRRLPLRSAGASTAVASWGSAGCALVRLTLVTNSFDSGKTLTVSSNGTENGS